MNRPVPAPIHTKSFNVWKTNFARWSDFLQFRKIKADSPGRHNRELARSSKYINYLHVIFYQRKRLLALIFK